VGFFSIRFLFLCFQVQIRLCRQLKYIENNLVVELKTVEHDREILKNSLNDNLQERLKILQNKIDNYNIQIKNIVQQEKDYWKQLEQIIAKLVEKNN